MYIIFRYRCRYVDTEKCTYINPHTHTHTHTHTHARTQRTDAPKCNIFRHYLTYIAHSVDPKYGEAYCQLGDVYKDSENIGLALQAYLQGIHEPPLRPFERC
jgi:hypothetical protein